jgi:Tetracyclin repressor-like, C-terminal domain
MVKIDSPLARAAASSFRKRFNEADATTQAEMRDRLGKMREVAVQFPRLRARSKSASAEYGTAPQNTFEVGLNALLDGIAAKVEAHQR